MNIIGIDTVMRGTSNQIRGLIVQAQQSTSNFHNRFISAETLLWKSIDGKFLNLQCFNKQQLEKAIQARVSECMKQQIVPDIAVLPIDQSRVNQENIDADIVSELIKKSFRKYNINIKTLVIASNLYPYRDVDFIHVGAHQLSEADEKRLQTDKELRRRVILTLGVPSDLSGMQIKLAARKNDVIKSFLAKIASKPVVLFSVGGKTADNVIKFTLQDAEKIMQAARFFRNNGYAVVIANSPRTPNEVTDYFFQQYLQDNEILFFNSKNIAKNEEEKSNFRFYSGIYAEALSEQYSKYGNIYPAILDVCDFVVNTHDSFSYTSDVAALGIPSVVYTGNEIGETRRDCHKLFELCHTAGYVVSLEEAINIIAEGGKISTTPITKVSKQILSALQQKMK
ncbi:MAG: mitochondrial fission ELM1 family protein [Alphaproteobacteria bacterium]|nr:mitochondrial fission ELM1 family protein [Alphaproteobacteria bacterium]